jgi:serine/threonine protein phosphatase PrpC
VNIAILRKGKVKRRTIDETKEQIMLAHGSSDIDARENAHIIVNAICAEEDILACDPQNFDLQKGDIVIIGCDGVMKGLSNQDLESAIANRTPKEMTAWLASKGFEGYDNITASVIDIT